MGKIKDVILNGLPYGLVFFSLSFIPGYYFLGVGLRSILWVSSLLGGAALLANGLIYGRFSKPLKDLEEITLLLPDGESAVLEAPANHLIEGGYVPGKLALTEYSMVFKTLGSAAQPSRDYTWRTNQLTPVAFAGTLLNAGGEIVFHTLDRSTLMFEVDHLRSWKKEIQSRTRS